MSWMTREKIAIKISNMATMPPTTAALSRLNRVQAMRRGERPWIATSGEAASGIDEVRELGVFFDISGGGCHWSELPLFLLVYTVVIRLATYSIC